MLLDQPARFWNERELRGELQLLVGPSDRAIRAKVQCERSARPRGGERSRRVGWFSVVEHRAIELQRERARVRDGLIPVCGIGDDAVGNPTRNREALSVRARRPRSAR